MAAEADRPAAAPDDPVAADDPRLRLRTLSRLMTDVAVVLVVATGAITIGLLVTPMQRVTAVGQTVEVGVTAPSLSWSGPGELDLFGQRIKTQVDFAGPVRPRVRLAHITLSQQLAEFTEPGSKSGADSLKGALVKGWWHYFYWEIAIVGIAAVLLLGAVSGWLRHGWRRSLVVLAAGVLVTEGINLGAIMFTAYTVPDTVAHIRSLQDLVGGATTLPKPSSTALDATGRNVVVVGDSTAAGLGNRPLPDPTAIDRACQRSADSYARDLEAVTQWRVTNLACSGATIAQGLLGPQEVGGVTVPPQLSDPAVARASTLILSIGANDVRWSNLLQICAVSKDCSNNAERAFFQQRLAGFSTDYFQLLSDLQQLPNHPRILINLYYNPFSSDVSCLESVGITAEKQAAMTVLLNAMNDVIEQGAQAASFSTAQPDFTDHGVCADSPWVQGVDAAAPFHPTPGGELAIALADERALSAAGS